MQQNDAHIRLMLSTVLMHLGPVVLCLNMLFMSAHRRHIQHKMHVAVCFTPPPTRPRKQPLHPTSRACGHVFYDCAYVAKKTVVISNLTHAWKCASGPHRYASSSGQSLPVLVPEHISHDSNLLPQSSSNPQKHAGLAFLLPHPRLF